MLTLMGMEAVERNYQARHVKRIPDKNLLAAEENYCQTATKNREEGFIAHANLKIAYQLV